LFKEKCLNLFFNAPIVIGEIAQGSENLNSTAKAYHAFRKAIRQTSATQIIAMLG
jgi:hypothetical protein